jgi:bacillithiol biosynthesis cysteine-adding enzyme BshC
MSFRDDYLQQSPAASRFLAPSWATASDRANAVTAARGPNGLDTGVVAALRTQTERWASHAAQHEACAALCDHDAVAVVTGQQVGLWGGPLYTLHKAACAIRVARQLQEETGRRVVPVFWLQTEDHDDDEIARAHLIDAQADHTVVAMKYGHAGERRSVAHLSLDDTPFIDDAELNDLLQGLPFASDAARSALEHYQPGARVADAFAGLLSEWFGAHGLLLFEVRDALVAPAAARFHAWAIEKSDDINQALKARAAELEGASYGTQVNVRTDCALSFWHPEGADGPRHRLQCGTHDLPWSLAGHSARFSRAELLEQLSVDPMLASSSALLRPIIQDSLLPVAAWVGGPAEIHYAAQMEPLYALAGVRRPMIIPRTTMRWHLEPWESLRTTAGLEVTQLTAPVDELLHELHGDDGLDADRLHSEMMTAIGAIVDDVASKYASAGSSVAQAQKKTLKTVGWATNKFVQNIKKQLLRADEGPAADIEQMKAFFYPSGTAHERLLSPLCIAAAIGTEAMVRAAIDACEPFTIECREVRVHEL